MNMESKENREVETKESPKTGYKVIDATVYVLTFLVEIQRKNSARFIIAVILMALIVVSYLYVTQTIQTKAALESKHVETKVSNNELIEYLKNEVATLKVDNRILLSQTKLQDAEIDSLKLDIKECQNIVKDFYVKTIKNRKK